jgi:hypothetical protein
VARENSEKEYIRTGTRDQGVENAAAEEKGLDASKVVSECPSFSPEFLNFL